MNQKNCFWRIISSKGASCRSAILMEGGSFIGAFQDCERNSQFLENCSKWLLQRHFRLYSNMEGKGQRRYCRRLQNEQICLPQNAVLYKSVPKAANLIFAIAVDL